MKNLKYLPILALIPCVVFAQASTTLVSDKVLAKCYVELLGGKRVVYKLTLDKEEKIPTLMNKLPNSEVRAPGVAGKAKIYKVFQCVKNDVDFKNGRARVLEQNQVR